MAEKKENNQGAIETKILFWNVDTQYDFMRNDETFKGALPVEGARAIEQNLGKLTQFARIYDIKVVNTGDWHTLNDREIDNVNPDFKTTYFAHCMQNTKGAEHVPVTAPTNPAITYWDRETFDKTAVQKNRDVVIYKNEFDAFVGSKHTEEILNIINPKTVFVYGVATNVCVDFAVKGLLQRGKEVYVVEDAIKELPKEIAAQPLEDVLKQWNFDGNVAKFIRTSQVEDYLRK